MAVADAACRLLLMVAKPNRRLDSTPNRLPVRPHRLEVCLEGRLERLDVQDVLAKARSQAVVRLGRWGAQDSPARAKCPVVGRLGR